MSWMHVIKSKLHILLLTDIQFFCCYFCFFLVGSRRPKLWAKLELSGGCFKKFSQIFRLFRGWELMIKYCDKACIVLLGQTPDKAGHYPLLSVLRFYQLAMLKRKKCLWGIQKIWLIFVNIVFADSFMSTSQKL